jgi:Zn finger protein HypA/HybF involved in hydrogenase expression
LSKFVYKTQRTKATLICQQHGEFKADPKELWSGTGCPSCGKEKFIKPKAKWSDVIKRLKRVHGEKYIFHEDTYQGVRKHIKVFCPIHDYSWEPRVNDLLKGQGCRLCGIESSAKKRLLSVGEFITRSQKVHGDKYDYNAVHQFKTQKEYVKINCPFHGQFEQSAQSHMLGSECPKCWIDRRSKALTSTWGDVLSFFREVHGYTYEYDSSTYTSSQGKIRIICKKHGAFTQVVSIHKSGQGCPKCGRDRISESLTTSWKDVLKAFREVHRDEYEYQEDSYTLLEVPMNIKCRKHGIFSQTPKNHRSGSGCPICRSSRGEKEMEHVLTDLKIVFEHQKKFPELGLKRFDYYIPFINTIIEYNGIQHYEPIEFFRGIDGYNKLIKSDFIKRKYCEENGINYEIIRYDEDVKDRIKEILSSRL